MDPYEREVDQGVRSGSKHIEDTTLKDTGHDFGKALSKGMGDELEKSGPDLVHRVEKGLEGKRVRWKVKTTVDKDNNVVRRVVEETFQDIEKAFNEAAKPGGPLSKVGQGLADAIGNAFNISGRSPLIAFFIPVVGGIVELVIGAIQAINALVAVAGTAPAALAAIGLQVGVLFLAFKGLGSAITDAFAAKNATELKAALKDLTPAAQDFVKQLLPLRDLFHQLSTLSQQSFFKALGDVIPRIQKALGPEFLRGFGSLATALGKMFRDIALFFASPVFVEFVHKLFPATIQFLREFGPSFVELLKGVTAFSTAITPFLSFLGGKLSEIIFNFGSFLLETSKDPAFKKFLKDMGDSLLALGDLFKSVIDLVAAFFESTNKAGGTSVIEDLAVDIHLLAEFIASPQGQKAIEGFIHASEFLAGALIEIVIAIGLVFDGFERLLEFFKHDLIPGFVDVANGVALGIQTAVIAVWHFVVDIWHAVTDFFEKVGASIKVFVRRFLQNFLDLGGLLFDAGRNMIQGLIDGMLSKLGPVRGAISFIAQTIRNHWPFSPAKTGPLSGAGDPMIAGQKTIQRFAEGMKLEIPELRSVSSDMVSNIVFGPGAIRVDFNGQLPTQDQAQQTGSAVGAGINRQLAARDTRLAVRTL
jgi:phage-related protein